MGNICILLIRSQNWSSGVGVLVMKCGGDIKGTGLIPMKTILLL